MVPGAAFGWGGPAVDTFEALIEEALCDRWEGLPLLATYHGVRGYDHTLGDPSLEAAQERLRVKKRLLGRLKAAKPRDREEELDRKVLLGQLQVQVAEISEYRRLEWDPALYPLQATRSLHALLARDLPASYRREMLRSRLSEVPRYLAAGLENLRRADAGQARLALSACESARLFLRQALGGLDGRDFRKAQEALEDYESGIKARALPGAGRRFPLGRELFELKLKREHGLDLDASGLVEVGREAMADTRRALREAAGEIASGADWREIMARMKKRHPPETGLLAAYRSETARARRFCLEKGLVSLPQGEALEIVLTPRFEWETSPYAALLPPGAFGKSLKSLFYVTPVDRAWPEAKKRERLEGHCVWGLPSVCPHEGYPGHHVQLARSARIASKVRRVFSTPVLIEGWGFYCEQMMEEEGYMTDPRARLYRLKDQLWRACRVVVDAGLHVGGWSRERAVDFLVREAMLERPNAQAEADRYATSGTQPMSYLLGKLEILGLRERCRRAWGKGFSLRRFHDWLLGFGNMPPGWIPVARTHLDRACAKS